MESRNMPFEIKRVIIELEEPGHGFVIPGANIEEAYLESYREADSFFTTGEPWPHIVSSPLLVKLHLLLVSDELEHYWNVPEELDSGPRLIEEGGNNET